MAGGYASGSITAAKLVAKKQGLNYEVANGTKQAVIVEGAFKRYLVVLVFNGLNSKKHKKTKSDVKHVWVQNNSNSLPSTYERLMEITGGYKRMSN